MELEDTPTLTQNPDTDLYILSHLNDKDLYETCQSNRYVFHLCQNSKPLRERVRKYAHKFDIFEAGPDVGGEFLLAMDPETLYNTCQLNTYSYSLCQNNPVLRKRISDYKAFVVKVENIIHNGMDVNLTVKNPSYYKIVNVLNEMNINLLHSTNDLNYNDPQIYKITINYYNTGHSSGYFIDIQYIDDGKGYTDEFAVTPTQLKTFLITNYNNHTIDIPHNYQ